MPRLTKKQIRDLREVRRLVTLESVYFGEMWVDPGKPLPKNETEVTEFIRERTRLYRETWILPVLDKLLKEGGAK